MSIRILLVDDHLMFRQALRAQLAGETDMEIIAEAACAAEALAAVAQHQPDVAILDIALAEGNGIELARTIRAAQPQTRILALSGYSDQLYVEEMMKAGALGYVVKSAGMDELLRAIHAVMNGNHFLSPEVTAGMLRQSSTDSPPSSILSTRERQVLHAIAAGQRSTAIAELLGITRATVEVHRRNIKNKLGLHSVAELTRYAIRQGIQSP